MRTAVYLSLWPRGRLYRVTRVLLLTSVYIYAFYLQLKQLVFPLPISLFIFLSSPRGFYLKNILSILSADMWVFFHRY